jgi:hypothetical protein
MDNSPGSCKMTIVSWREYWLANIPVNGDILDDPSAVSLGFDLKRREWVIPHSELISHLVTRRFAIAA